MVKTAIIRFVKHHKQYNPGERAAFELPIVLKAIRSGHAILDDPEVTEQQLGLGDETKAPELDVRTHALTVEQVAQLTTSVNSLEELQALWEGEKRHPNHPDGRAGALKAIRARAEEVKARVAREAEANNEDEGAA